MQSYRILDKADDLPLALILRGLFTTKMFANRVHDLVILFRVTKENVREGGCQSTVDS